VYPLACNWYYYTQFIAKPKAVCVLRFSWVAMSSELGSKYDVIHKTGSTQHTTTPSEKDRAMATGNMQKKFMKIGRVDPKI